MSESKAKVIAAIWATCVIILITSILTDIRAGYADDINKMANHVYMKCPEAIEYMYNNTDMDKVFDFSNIGSVRKVISTCELRRLHDAIQTSKLDDQISIPDYD